MEATGKKGKHQVVIGGGGPMLTQHKCPEYPLHCWETKRFLASVLLLYRQGDVVACRHWIIVIFTVPKGRAASKPWHVVLNVKNQNAKIISGRGKNGPREWYEEHRQILDLLLLQTCEHKDPGNSGWGQPGGGEPWGQLGDYPNGPDAFWPLDFKGSFTVTPGKYASSSLKEPGY